MGARPYQALPENGEEDAVPQLLVLFRQVNEVHEIPRIAFTLDRGQRQAATIYLQLVSRPEGIITCYL